MQRLLVRHTFSIVAALVFAGCDVSPITAAPTDDAASRAGLTRSPEPPIGTASDAMVAAGGLNLTDAEVADDIAANGLERLEAGSDRCGDQGIGSEVAVRNAGQQRRGGCLAITSGTIVDTPLAETFKEVFPTDRHAARR